MCIRNLSSKTLEEHPWLGGFLYKVAVQTGVSCLRWRAGFYLPLESTLWLFPCLEKCYMNKFYLYTCLVPRIHVDIILGCTAYLHAPEFLPSMIICLATLQKSPGTAWRTQQRAWGIDLSSKLPRSQSDWASAETNPVHGDSYFATRGIQTFCCL